MAVSQTSPVVGPLYDARRDLYYVKPQLRGWMHLIWFEISLVLGSILLATTHGGLRLWAAGIYTASVSGLFGASALYHRGAWGQVWNRRLQRLDHAMIFFIIAGTATPAFLLGTHGTYRWVCLSVLWTLTVLGTTIHSVRMDAPELLMGFTFVGLGFVAGLGIPAVWVNVGTTPGILMLAGGLLYLVGALSFYRRWPDPSPAIFGYHEVFHAYVCAAAACQYVAVALFIL
jgi:hemolysin III